MTSQVSYFCDVDKRPAMHLNIPGGEHETPVSETEVEVRSEVLELDLCPMCLARELAVLVTDMDYDARKEWVARVRSGKGALGHGV